MTRITLGAHVDGDGVGFAVFSGVADAVEVCLFDDEGRETRKPLELDEGYVWSGHVDGIGAGARYGFRVHGPWDPDAGLRCNPAKLGLHSAPADVMIASPAATSHSHTGASRGYTSTVPSAIRASLMAEPLGIFRVI